MFQKLTKTVAVSAICIPFAAILLLAPGTCSGAEITIEVAPRTLNLDSDGSVVTVHTDLPFWSVDVTSVYINGVAIAWWKADNRGNFVAKFSMDDVKMLDGLIIGDYNRLQLVGLTTDGEEFWGEAWVMVIDVSATGQATR